MNLIQTLGLQPHPREGGWFVETHRSAQAVTVRGEQRSLATAIYFLVLGGYPTELHCLPGDELFHYYAGEPLELFLFSKSGGPQVKTLGPDIEGGMRPQILIPGGVWQAARVRRQGAYALVGTTMAPGFDYRDYQAAGQDEWAARHPQAREAMRSFFL
jgi:predicted cupin superfamily sugar epimerase